LAFGKISERRAADCRSRRLASKEPLVTLYQPSHRLVGRHFDRLFSPCQQALLMNCRRGAFTLKLQDQAISRIAWYMGSAKTEGCSNDIICEITKLTDLDR
jgi:hypothetical protein